MNIAVFFGGESCEHDISIITGGQFIANCDSNTYNVIPVYISKNGDWFTGDDLKDIDNFNQKDFIESKKIKRCAITSNDNSLYVKSSKKYKLLCKIDCAVLCLHGCGGEDGSVAGVLELSKIPYTSPSLLGSSVCLDKGVFKTVCKGLDIPVVDGFCVGVSEYLKNQHDVFQKISNLGYPVILKPCRQGSSIGVSVVENEEVVNEKILESFKYDDKLLIEKFMKVDKEVNIALFNNKGNMIFSNTEEPISNDIILSFDDKYLKNSGGFETIKRLVPANISVVQLSEIKEFALKIYNELELFGIVRFDFLISYGKIYVNEVNTIPGSMANYLFDKEVYGYAKLIEMLVSNAVLRFERSKNILKTLDTGVLSSGVSGFKK